MTLGKNQIHTAFKHNRPFRHKNRFLLLFILFFFSITVLFACSKRADISDIKPDRTYNIIIFTFDSLGARYLDLYGFGKQTAPNLTAYAAECHLFKNAIAQSGSTSYSLGSLFTSRYPFTDHLIVDDNTNVFKKNKLYLPYQLKSAGYNTGAVVRDHYSGAKYGFDLGFDFFDDDFLSSDAEETAVSAIQQLNRLARPFFIWVHNEEPHAPYLPPEDYFRRFYPENSLPTVYDFLDPDINKTFEIFRSEYQPFNEQLKGLSKDVSRYELYGRNVELGNLELEQLRARYLANIRYADDHFGKFITYVKSQPWYKNTLVIITADHGESLGNHNIFDHNSLYNEILHVPLLIHLPGQKKNKTHNSPVELVDIYPTVMDLIGLEITDPIRGEHLFALDRKKTIQFSEYQDARIYATESAIFWSFDDHDGYSFDRLTDPDEQHKRPESNLELLRFRYIRLPETIFYSDRELEIDDLTTATPLQKGLESDVPFKLLDQFPQLSTWTFTRVKRLNRRIIYSAEKKGSVLKIEALKNTAAADADNIIAKELFQINAIYNSHFSPYPERITNHIECPSHLKPRQFKMRHNNKEHVYLLTYANKRFGIGVFNEDQVAGRLLIAWIPSQKQSILYRFKYYLPMPVDDNNLHDFFYAIIAQSDN